MRKRPTFVAVHGQFDNIGDSVLRRAMLRASEDGGPRHVLVGRGGLDFASGLGLSPADRVYTQRRRWQIAAYASAARGPVRVLSNAGEMQANRRRALIALADLPLLALARVRPKSFAAHTGVGVRDIGRRAAWSIRVPARLCDVVAWRDQKSCDLAGFGSVRPDWAIAEGRTDAELRDSAASASHRDLLIVSMRGDRQFPAPAWIAAVSAVAKRHGLKILVINQVARDRERAHELAAALDADLDEWRGGDHAKREAEVRDLYGRTRLIVSDRLHGLIVAATEGARIVGTTMGPDTKLGRTLAGVRLKPLAHEVDDATAETDIASWAEDALTFDVATAVIDSRSELTTLAADLKRGARRVR